MPCIPALSLDVRRHSSPPSLRDYVLDSSSGSTVQIASKRTVPATSISGVGIHDAERATGGCDEHIAWLPVRLLGQKGGRVGRLAVPKHEQKAVDGRHRTIGQHVTAGPSGEGPGRAEQLGRFPLLGPNPG
jgi:hypothetical protein